MPNYIVLRLTPAKPIDPVSFEKYLEGLTVNLYEISFAHPRAGLPGDPTPPLGSAIYDQGTPAVPQPIATGGPYVTYPANTTIAQHYSLETFLTDVVAVDFKSVATALVPYAGGTEYVGPDLRIVLERSGAAPIYLSETYYDVALYNAGSAPDPSQYQFIPTADVAAYLTLDAPLDPSIAQLQLPTDGTPPGYDALMAAVTTVLKKDPGGTPSQAEIAGLTAEQCRNIAYEIVYGPQLPLPVPPDQLENMYTDPPNDGTTGSSDEQSRQEFQGNLQSYYSTNDATAERITGFVYALACAVWCESQTQAADRALISFPVNPAAISPGLTTVTQAEVLVTGALGADVPAEYFYALTAQLPIQISPVQRYQLATTADQQQILAQLSSALAAGMIVMPPTAPQPAVNPAQAARLLNALAVPAALSVVQCPIAHIQPIWTDWMGFPSLPLENWTSYEPGDDLTVFWPKEAIAQPGPFLDLVLFALTQGYVDTATSALLADEIKANLLVTPPAGPPPPPAHIAAVSDLAQALPVDWQTFFTPGGVVAVNLLPPFTLPGTPDDRVTTFIRYVQKFFDMPTPVPGLGPTVASSPDTLPLPVSDLIEACIAAYGGLTFGAAPLSPADLANLAAAAASVAPGDKPAQDWLVQTINSLNDLAILANLPGKPAGFQFSVMEALYARGFTDLDSVLELPLDNFTQALTGTVAYDFAATLYANAGIATGTTPPSTGPFTPVNPGGLTDCIPPRYLSPFGPIEYLHEMLNVSEQSTCEAPFVPPAAGHLTLGQAIASRRGPIGDVTASEANLETALPRIDLVNECLEFMASTIPPTKHGAIYGTSGDALAGHVLCAEACCEHGCDEQFYPHHTDESHPHEACHEPRLLFLALPQYSTPATPVAANAAVLPAAYDKLKVDFSGCCQPYSQALDVSRTYLRHFQTCRFEAMRSFRKCITEFVLDPKNEPAGFQSHLWRYPVRIDTAIEYLGLSPETYALLFAGPPPAPCAPPAITPVPGQGQGPGLQPWTLYGFAAESVNAKSWTGVVVRLPEFLRRTCLDYCDFLALWKTGFVAFRNGADRKQGLFPDCEPCCLDDYWLVFPEANGSAADALFKLAIFIRLHCLLKDQCGAHYTFAQLQDICEVLKLFIGSGVNPDFIRQLAAFQMLRDRFEMPLFDRAATIPPGATGSARTQLLALWDIGAAAWDWAIGMLIERIAAHAMCHHHCDRRRPEFEKLLAANLDPLSSLAGFDPATAANTWLAVPTHTLRFAEVLAKIYASNFGIGEILYLFTAADHLDGDDPFPLQDWKEAQDLPLDLPEDEHHGLWALRHALLEAGEARRDGEDWNWHRIADSLRHDFGFAATEIRAFGEHFFPGTLERLGIVVDPDRRRFTSPLAVADTAPLMWNALPRGPFQYDDVAGQLWTELPFSDQEALGQLTRLRALQPKEQAAVQDLYFQPRAMLARFALLFSDYPEAERRLIQERGEEERWAHFREQFALCHARCGIIADHLAAHVAAVTGQNHPEGAHTARLVLASLQGDENKAAGGASWENDSGVAPAVTWAPPGSGGAYAALLGLAGTGMIADYATESGTLVWRSVAGIGTSVSRADGHRNCPVPTVLPALDLVLQPAQMRFVSVHNGLAMKDSTGAWLGGAAGFVVTWSGALLVDREGPYDFVAHLRETQGHDIERQEEIGRRRWRVTLKRGQKVWVLVSHHWHAEHDRKDSSFPLRRGAYELIVDYVQPTPAFAEADELFPLHTGLDILYAGPDTGGERIPIPHRNLIQLKKEDILGAGLSGLSPGAASYLGQLYVSSLRDIRRTYQRTFKALLFVHHMGLSGEPRSVGQSELGYMLAHGDLFVGASYYSPGGAYQMHKADFDFNLLPVRDNFHSPTTDSRTDPSPRRMQALFDWWERMFDYDRVRREVRRHSERPVWLLFDEAADKQPAHPAYLLRHMGADARHWEIDLRYFQGQAAPVYEVPATDLEDDRWLVRAWHADLWIRALLRAFAARDITRARPDLWASDDPSALVTGEAETGNANLSQFLVDGCIETGQPRRYEDLKRLTDGLRERGRRALIAHLCGPVGIVHRPKELSDILLIDVEAGLLESASRIDDATSAVQAFIQRARLALEPGWAISKPFALLWDRRFASFRVWEACKRREIYKENWIEWCEIEKAKGIEAFRFLDERLRRATLTIARPGGVDFWPDDRPPTHPSLMSLQEREPSTMRMLTAPREGLDLLGTEDRAGRPTWLTEVPEMEVTTKPPPGNGTILLAASSGGGAPAKPKLPYWMESAVALGTRFIRIAASGRPPAATEFKPHPEHKNHDGETCCVECCIECGKIHPPHMEEYYFWLVDGDYFEAVTLDSYYDRNLQSATPWHDPAQLHLLLEWPKSPTVRLAWCRVHNGEFGQLRRSAFGCPVPAGGATPDLVLEGRVSDSLYFTVTNASSTGAGFRYDVAPEAAIFEAKLVVPINTPISYPGGLFAYPFFAYLSPGKRLFPWSPYTPALAVAQALRAHCRFEAALKWYAQAYDPLQSDNAWMRCEGKNPPEGGEGGVILEVNEERSQCCDASDVSCAVARHRSILLHYVETLLQWSEATMRTASPEAFQKARLILDTAVRIMGPIPRSVIAAPPAATQTVATFTPLPPPLNPRLMMLYGHIADHVGLVHAWIDARRLRNGTLGRDVGYFGDDPLREGWRSTCETCSDELDWCLPASPYRFAFLVAKARDFATSVREMGASLLTAFEKADAEYVASMRARHERELAALGLQAKQNQFHDADWQVQALQKTKENRQNDRRYYSQLIQAGLINNEQQYVNQVGVAQNNRVAGMFSEGIGEAAVLVPDLFVGFPCEETQQPVGTKLAGLFQALARVCGVLAEMAGTDGSLDLTKAGWDRRLQDWVHRVELLDIEIEQFELQILGAERRRAQALREVNIQQRQIEQAGELQDFLRDKLSSHAVYLSLQKDTAELYYKMYELAHQSARQAERAFNFERGHTTRRFLPEEGWDNLHDGLLAGEKLLVALDHMEKDYEDRNLREEELTKHISLRLHFPMDFLRLKITGRCEFEIPEWLFDLDYPGHYMRRIKSVALTIPCVTGPYTGVHCRLTLLSSETRIDPILMRPPQRCCSECKMDSPYMACAHDARMVRHYAAREAIATSSGRNDSGMFELNFRDERYLPFEYQGAVSRWRLELPHENNFFDMDSLTDVVLHLNYTAREGGDLLHAAASEVAQKNLPGGCWTYFDLRHDFPDAWELFRISREQEDRPREFTLRFDRDLFPYLPGRRDILLHRVALLFETADHAHDRCDIGECPCPEPERPDRHMLDLITCEVETHGRHEARETDMQCLASREWPGLYHGVAEVQAGPITPQGGHVETKFHFHGKVGRIVRAFLFCQYSGDRRK